jgi:RNA polymerase sigma-70 factor (ECF subfamily)
VTVPVPELELVRRVVAGNTGDYAPLVRAHQAKILGLCASLLSDATQAEDAAQEIFLKAYRSLSTFKGGSKFSTWLYRIASNHCMDLLRKRSREKSESLDALLERTDEGKRKSFEPFTDPREASNASDLVERLLGTLSGAERLILTLREAQGLNYEEIAQTLNCSLDAVKSRLRRARQALEEKKRHFSAQDFV